jgi:hypothetical protein
MTTRRISPVSLLVGLLTALLIVVGPSGGAAEPPKNAVVGSWVETVTFPPEFNRPPLKSLSTFNEGGTFVNSDLGHRHQRWPADPARTPPAMTTGGYGQAPFTASFVKDGTMLDADGARHVCALNRCSAAGGGGRPSAARRLGQRGDRQP